MRTPLAQLAAVALLAPALLVLGSAPADAAIPVCNGHVATIIGTPHHDDLVGTARDDVIVGGDKGDAINGGGGNDVICGNRGSDKIIGGAGDDIIWGQIGRDSISGGTGDDSLGGGQGVITYFPADAGDDHYGASSQQTYVMYDEAPGAISLDLGAGTASGWGNDTFDLDHTYPVVMGSAHSDTLTGSDRNEQFQGSTGKEAKETFDTLDGKGGNDVLATSEGSMTGGDGNDWLGGLGGVTPTSDSSGTMDGGPGNDELAFQGVAQVLGGSGDDVVSRAFRGAVPPGELNVNGGDGTDRLVLYNLGESGGYPLTLDLTAGTLDVEGSQGTAAGFENFSAQGFATSFDLTGTNGPNILEISTNDREPITVHGLDGDDVMNGADGDDVLYGGPGDDTADARLGTDICTSIEIPSSCEVLNP